MKRTRLTAAAMCAALLLGACAAPAPPPQLYQLRSAPPVAPVVPRAAVPSTLVLQLVSPVRIPELLEHTGLLLPQGQAGLQALASHRWAEPLRDAVPRVLRQDLAALLGEQRVWASPLPPGVNATRQLRLEVLELQANTQRSGVRLQVRYAITHPSGMSPAQARTLLIEAPSADTTPDALVAAHRLALWQLAQALADAVVAP